MTQGENLTQNNSRESIEVEGNNTSKVLAGPTGATAPPV